MSELKCREVRKESICRKLSNLGAVMTLACMFVALAHNIAAQYKTAFYPVKEGKEHAYLQEIQHHRKQSGLWAVGGVISALGAALIESIRRNLHPCSKG